MTTNATTHFESDVSNDNEHYCLLCGRLTEQNPHTLHVRRNAGANHGDLVAKAHICRDCLDDTDGWTYNREQGNQ